MKYRERNRKSVTLPSGATVVIRKLTGYDFLRAGPAKLMLPDLAGNGRARHGRQGVEDVTDAAAIARHAIVHCTSEFCFDGETAVIVDKPFGSTEPTEISIEELDQADAQAIMDEIMAFSGFGKEAADQAGKFRETHEAGGGAASPGQGVRPTAERDLVAVPVGSGAQPAHP